MNERYTKYTERPASYCIFEISNGRKPEQADIEAANEQLNRFITDTINHQEPSEGDKQAAADALIAAMNGMDIQKVVGLKRKHGGRGSELKPHEYLSWDSKFFKIVCALVDGKISNGEAQQRFSDHYEDLKGKAPTETTIEKYINAIRPRAVQSVALGYAVGQIVRDARKQSRKKDD